MKNSPKLEVTYCYWEAPDPDYDDPGAAIPLVGGDLFEYEMHEIGLYEDDHVEFFNKLKTGYYKIQYVKGRDGEYDGPYTLYEYDVIESYESAEHSQHARWLYWKYRLNYRWQMFAEIFQKVWGLDWDYGGAGISSKNMYFPKALFLKIKSSKYYPGKRHEPSWGPGYVYAKIRKNYWGSNWEKLKEEKEK